MRILLVEDDNLLGDGVCSGLWHENNSVDWVKNGEMALSTVAEKDRKHVMQQFYRAKNHQTPGCGIGLSIVDRVAQLHQAEITLSQPDSGTGLKVIIKFN